MCRDSDREETDMILVYGGAYQGKLEYAKTNFDIKDICDCSGGGMPDFSADAVYGLDGFVLQCAGDGREAADCFRSSRRLWQDKVLIMTDVSQGLVPMSALERSFREMNGRLMLYLASEAEQVHRVFCGIGKRVK